ncbi:hypothetical protein B566_EDAN014222 [Ephemera danica]|nr:hypothetical protein B566_EDAN014222 [Ephemera danica]
MTTYLYEMIDHTTIKIFTSQMRVTSIKIDTSNVPPPKSKIRTFRSPVPYSAVSDSSGGGFVDNAENVKGGDHSCIFGGLTLRVVKVSGHRDYSVRHCLTEIRFSSLLHLCQHHRANFLWRESLRLVFIHHL